MEILMVSHCTAVVGCVPLSSPRVEMSEATVVLLLRYAPTPSLQGGRLVWCCVYFSSH